MSSIKLNNFSISIENKVFVNNLSLELNSGDVLGIVGDSGSGKTVLATSIAGIIQQNLKLEGEITRDYKRLAILFQNPTNQLFSIDVYEELKNSILQSNKIFDNKILDKESKKWGVENLLNKKIDKLSLGEAQQVALASIMISKPDLIILDEPAQYIDEESFNDRFSKIKENLPNTIIIIVEHNYNLINRLSTIIIKLEDDNYSFIKKLEIPSFKTFKVIRTEEKLLELKNIKFSYQKEENLINIDSLIIKKGDFLHLKGKNGTGKSTLAKIIIRLIKQNSGNILYYNPNCKNPKLKKIRKRVSYIFQNPDNQIFASKVQEEIYYSNNGVINNNIENWIDKFNLRELLERSPHILSFGERRRVNILSAISHNPEIIIYDEPSTGLDYKNRITLLKFMNEQNQKGITQILISHDKWFTDKIQSKSILNMSL